MKKNEQTILKAFDRIKAEKDEVIKAGMYALLEDAVQYALEAHDEKHQSHIQFGDTYGWVLVHNREIVELSVVSTAENKGNASRKLLARVKELPSKGWAGVVMAGLQPSKYFAVVYELGMLGYSIHMTKDNFLQYFKPL